MLSEVYQHELDISHVRSELGAVNTLLAQVTRVDRIATNLDAAMESRMVALARYTGHRLLYE